jgi:hypothetical protein
MKTPIGYYPKIEYWTLKLNQAVASKATVEVGLDDDLLKII